MDALLRITRSLLLLLFLSALALGLLRGAASGGSTFESVIALGISLFVFWQLGRLLRRLWPRRRRTPETRPELPTRGQWVGPRSRDYEREH